MKQLDTLQRFARKIVSMDCCWEWGGAKMKRGYGRFMLNGENMMAHRVIYELLIGPIPPGLTVDHLCRNTSCMNPGHMEIVTLAENLRRRPIAGTAFLNAIKTHCPRGHELSGDNLRGGQRINNRACKACCAINARNRRLRCV